MPFREGEEVKRSASGGLYYLKESELAACRGPSRQDQRALALLKDGLLSE